MLTRQSQVILSGTCSLIFLMGIARFSFTSFLPDMQKAYGLSDSAAGLLAGINYLGYLLGALIAIRVSAILTRDRLFRASLIVGLVTTPMMAMGSDIFILALSRFFAGLAAAGGMMIASGLILNWLIRHGHRAEMGGHFAGIGLGIAGVALFAHFASGYWSVAVQWYILSIFGFGFLIIAWLWRPNPLDFPSEKIATQSHDIHPTRRFLTYMLPAYFCAGYGFVVMATFIVAQIERSEALAGYGQIAFLLVGIAGAPATLIWDRINRKYGDGFTLILAYLVNALAILIPLIHSGILMMFLGALLFGFSFLGIVSLVLTMAGRFYPNHPARLMGKMTIWYGAAQILAPVITGFVADFGWGLDAGLYLAFIIQFAGALLVARLVMIGGLNLPSFSLSSRPKA